MSLTNDLVNGNHQHQSPDNYNFPTNRASNGTRYSVAMVAACPFPANYGTPGAIREMSETLAALGHDIHIVTYPFGEDLPLGSAKLWRAWYWRKAGKLYAGPSLEKLLLDVFLLIKLCRVVKTQRISIIHAHNYEAALLGFIAKLVTRTPLLYNAVSLMSDELPTYNFLKPACAARALARFLDWLIVKIPNHFIAITENLRAEFLERSVRPDRIALVPCGIKPEMFESADPKPLRMRYGIGQQPVVMYTGVNSGFQRIDYLLRSFSLVLKEEPCAILMVVSPLADDPDVSRNRSLAERLGVMHNVVWVQGQTLAQLPDYLAMASVAVIPRPNIPGHPIKLLNYMAAGKAIVCFEGAAKGVQHLRDAYVVKDHDIEAMSQGILTLLRDKALAERLGAAARDTVRRNFDWRDLCLAVEEVYASMTGQDPTHAAPPIDARLAVNGHNFIPGTDSVEPKEVSPG